MFEYNAPLKCRYHECVLEMILDLMEVPSVEVMRQRLIKTGKSLGTQSIADSYEALRRIGILSYGAGQRLIINPKYIQVDKTAIWQEETKLTGLKRGERAQLM